ncbi:2816_t:CDS:1, partial [Acaulospora morrowiae]
IRINLDDTIETFMDRIRIKFDCIGVRDLIISKVEIPNESTSEGYIRDYWQEQLP